MVFNIFETDRQIDWCLIDTLKEASGVMVRVLEGRNFTEEGAREFFYSYRDIIKFSPASLVDHLNLFLNDEIHGRICHLNFLTDLVLKHTDHKGVFMEGLEVSGTRRTHPRSDFMCLECSEVCDVTSDWEAAEEKEEYVNRTFSGIRSKSCEVFLRNDVKKGRMKFLMRWLVNKTVDDKFKTAKVVAFSDSEARDEFSQIYEDILQITLDKVERSLGPSDKLRKGDIHLLLEMARFNNLTEMTNFVREFQGSSELAGLHKYLHSGVPLKARKSYRFEPCGSYKVKHLLAKDPLSRFILFLVSRGDEVPDRWMAYKDKEGLSEYGNYKQKKGRTNYLVGACEPHALVRKVSPRVFDIVFNIETFLSDHHMLDALLRHDLTQDEFKTRRDAREAAMDPSISSKPLSVLEAYTEALNKVEEDMEVTGESVPTVFKKVMDNMVEMTLSEKVKRWSESLRKSLDQLFRTKTAMGMAHEYEVAKSVCASFCSRPGYDRYFVSENGSLNSYSLIQKNCTNDSLSNVFALTTYVKEGEGESLFSMHKSVSFNKNTLEWALKKPFISATMLHYVIETRASGIASVKHVAYDLAFMLQLISINRNIFAQAADQMRYLFTASLSYGATSSGIFKKLSSLQPVTAAEVVYVCNLVKTCSALGRMKECGYTKITAKGTGVDFAMPQDRGPCESMSYFVSSMYLSRLFNKNRAFPESSCARAAEGVLEEIELMKSLIPESKQLGDDTGQILEELRKVAESTGGRYVGSPAATAVLTLKFRPSKRVRDQVFSSTLNSAMNNHAAMSGTEVSFKRQASKSFLVAHETVQFLTDSGKDSNSTLNVYYLQALAMIKKLEDTESFSYCAYLTHKNQVGDREIYVMNGCMRLGTYFVEEVARKLSRDDLVNLQNTDRKEFFMEQMMAEAHDASISEGSRTWEVYDNADAKRWGPNMKMSVMAAHFCATVDPEEYDISALGLFTFQNMSEKKIKFPERLIDFANDRKEFGDRGIVNDFMHKHSKLLRSSEPFVVEPEGMGQGLFQEESSSLHAVKLEFQAEVKKALLGDDLLYTRYICTSDDTEVTDVIKVPDKEMPRTSMVFKKLLAVSVVSGCWFSILRNMDKSGFSLYYAEFNSRFYHKRSPAMPAAKFRASKVECGAGSDIFSDLCSSLESSGDYAAFGGSYMGSYSLLVCNYTFFLEQWGLTRRSLQKSGGATSHFGYLRFIDPAICQVFGPLANAVISDLLTAGPDEQKHLTIPCLKKVSHNLSLEMAESYVNMYCPETREEVEEDGGDLVETTGTGFYSGFCGLSRTPKMAAVMKVSKFERETVKTLHSPIFTSHCRNLRESRSVLVDRARRSQVTIDDTDMHKRFSDPWVSRDRLCFHRAKGSSAAAEFLPEEKMSFNQIKEILTAADFKGRFIKSLLKSPSPIPANLRPFASVWEEKLKGGMSLVESMSQFDQTIQTMTRRELPPMCTRTLEVPTVSDSDKLEFLLDRFVDNCRDMALPNLLEITGDTSQMQDQLCKEHLLTPQEFKSKHLTFESAISKFFPSRRKVMIPAADKVAGPFSYMTHMMRDKFVEGAGYEETSDQLKGVEEVFRTEVHLLKEESEAFEGLADKVSEHLNLVYMGKKSDLLVLTKDLGAMKGAKLESYLGKVSKNRLPIKRMTGKILASAFTGEDVRLNQEEATELLKGKLSVASRIDTKKGYTQFFPSTRFSCENNKPGMHFVTKEGKKYMHNFCLLLPKVRHRVPSIRVEKASGQLHLNVNELLYDGRKSSSGNNVRFLYPDQVSVSKLDSSPTSSCLTLKIKSGHIPLFPLTPSEKGLACMKACKSDFGLGLQDASDYLRAESAFNVFPEDNPLPSIHQVLCNPKFKTPGAFDEHSEGAAIAKVLLRKSPLVTNVSTLHNMVTRPFLPQLVNEELFTVRTLMEEDNDQGIAEDLGDLFGMDEEDEGGLWAEPEEGDDSTPEEQMFEAELLESMGALIQIDPGGRKLPRTLSGVSLLRTSSARNFLLTLRKCYIESCSTNFDKVKSFKTFVQHYGDMASLAVLVGSCKKARDTKMEKLGYLALLLSLRF